MNAKNEGNFSGDFCCKRMLQGSGENVSCQKIDHLNTIKIDDFEHTQKNNRFIDLSFDSEINQDLKPPQRILDQRPSRTSQEIAQNLERKLQEGAIRRHNHLNHIKQKCRLQIEKVIKVREKLAAKSIENSYTIEKELREKKELAEQIRLKFINERVEKFRNQVQYAESIKNKKMATLQDNKEPGKINVMELDS